jgi:hypothetical protein
MPYVKPDSIVKYENGKPVTAEANIKRMQARREARERQSGKPDNRIPPGGFIETAIKQARPEIEKALSEYRYGNEKILRERIKAREAAEAAAKEREAFERKYPQTRAGLIKMLKDDETPLPPATESL